MLFVCSIKIFQTLEPPIAFFQMLLENFQWLRVHHGGFVMLDIFHFKKKPLVSIF
jgi:hypothetical protein